MIRLATCSSIGGAEQDDPLLQELAEQARRPLTAVRGLLPDLGDVERVVHRLHHASDSSAGVVVSGASVLGACVGGRDRHVDLGAGRVEGDRGVDDELQRLAAGDVRAYRLQEATPVEIAPHLLRASRPCAPPGGRSRPRAPRRSPRSPPGRRPPGAPRSASTALVEPARIWSTNVALVLARRREPLRDRQALSLDAGARGRGAGAPCSWPTSASGGSTVTRPDELVEHAVAHRHLGLELAEQVDAARGSRRGARPRSRTRCSPPPTRR